LWGFCVFLVGILTAKSQPLLYANNGNLLGGKMKDTKNHAKAHDKYREWWRNYLTY